MRFHWNLVVLVIGLFAFRDGHANRWTPPNPEGQTRIGKGPIYGNGKTNPLQDMNPGSVYSPGKSPYPRFFLHLPGQYKLTTIQLLAQNYRNKADMRGINESFTIYTRKQFENPCKLNDGVGWTVCKSDVKFSQKGELLNVTCEAGTSEAEFVMIARGSPEATEPVEGPHIAEIWLYGERISNSTITPEPEDGPEIENYHLKTRAELLTGLETLWVEQAWVTYKQDNSKDDVGLTWHHGKLNGMAAVRGQGRAVTVLGTQWLALLYSDPKYEQFKQNLIKWLTQGKNTEAKFVDADKEFKDGDIIVVMRNQTFDVDKVKNAGLTGKNPLVVGYVGNRNKPQDNATQLLKELGITVIDTNDNYAPRNIYIKDVIGRSDYISLAYVFKMYRDSWLYMRTKEISYDFTTLMNWYMSDLSSSETQQVLKALLEKYYNYFRDRYPCAAKPYSWEGRVRTAWYNYNMFLLAQKTETVTLVPGVEHFIGLVSETEKPVSHRVTIKAKIRGYFYPTGVYVKAGHPFKWRVVEHSHNLDHYHFTIGCQKDNLRGNNPWTRWPRYMHLHQLSKEGSHTDSIGGVLFVRNVWDRQSITIELEGVFRHPWLDRRNQSTVEDWENERKRYNGVPWMAYIGDTIYMCLPVKDIVKMTREDIEFSTTYFDNVVKMINNFKGSRHEDDSPQVFATDIQLSAGWGHSGLPVMGHLPWIGEIVDIAGIKRQSAIGMTHELGHNLANGAACFKDGTEVVNNVYHFPVRGNLLNLSAYGFHIQWGFSDGDMNGVVNVWKGTEYRGVNLGYYNWLGMIFGEGLLVNLFHTSWGNSSSLRSEELKTNYWLTTICQETGYNVLPWQELWHFPINNQTREECAKYPCFFPDDELTKRVPELVERQLANYPNCVRKTEKKIQSRYDLWRALDTVGEQNIIFS